MNQLGSICFFMLITAQIAIVFAPIGLLSRHRIGIREKWLHPLTWLAGFYLLWFIVPQIYFLYSGGYLVGLERYSIGERLSFGIYSQLFLCLFLGIVVSVSLATQSLLRNNPRRVNEVNYQLVDHWVFKFYAILCFAVGCVANRYLGEEYLASDEMRSQLVKTTSGMIITSISFFGGYGFAASFTNAIFHKRPFIAVALLTVFALSIFFTGARGRLLWPVVISIFFYSCRRGRFITPYHIFFLEYACFSLSLQTAYSNL